MIFQMFRNGLKAFFYIDEVGRQCATVTLLHADPGSEWMPSKHRSDTCRLTYHLESREREAGRLL